MKIVGVIPARYASSRFPGKPLADICGKPMIWRVYKKVAEVDLFDKIIVAIDDERVANVCKQLNMNYIMTSNQHLTSLNRVHEVSTFIKDGNVFVSVNGDEPLITPDSISKIIKTYIENPLYSIINAMTTLDNPSEVIDFTNIKVVTNSKDECIYLSRSPIPYPKASLDFAYQKFVGITLLTRNALDIFYKKPRGIIEKIEDCDSIRFIENHILMKFVDIKSKTISVDTEKDLEKVRAILYANNQN